MLTLVVCLLINLFTGILPTDPPTCTPRMHVPVTDCKKPIPSPRG